MSNIHNNKQIFKLEYLHQTVQNNQEMLAYRLLYKLK